MPYYKSFNNFFFFTFLLGKSNILFSNKVYNNCFTFVINLFFFFHMKSLMHIILPFLFFMSKKEFIDLLFLEIHFVLVKLLNGVLVTDIIW